MALSAVSNSLLAKTSTSQQKTVSDTKQSETVRANSPAENNLSTKRRDDSVTLGQTGKVNTTVEVVDQKTAEELLSHTMKSILNKSKESVDAQANIAPQAANGIFVKN